MKSILEDSELKDSEWILIKDPPISKKPAVPVKETAGCIDYVLGILASIGSNTSPSIGFVDESITDVNISANQ